MTLARRMTAEPTTDAPAPVVGDPSMSDPSMSDPSRSPALRRRINDVIAAVLGAERRIDPYFRPAFERWPKPSLVRLVQFLIYLKTPDPRLEIAEEKRIPNEAAITKDITDCMAQFLRAQHYRPGSVLRAGNTKTYGVLRATLEVRPDVPERMRRGVFTPSRIYPAWVRLAGPGPLAPPDVKDNGILSMAIKLMDVDGDKLLDDENRTQDFFGLTCPTFTTPDIVQNLKLQRRLLEGTPLLYFLSPLDSHYLDAGMQALYSRTHTSPLEVAYYSNVAYLLGEGQAMHYAMTPSSDHKSMIPVDFPDDYLHRTMVATLAERDVEFDFGIQLQVDPRRMPIENASVMWPERLSPFIPVARLRIPRQRFDSDEQMRWADNLSYNPWHCIAEHRPLGNLNRARKTMYLELSKLRQTMNSTPRTEPTGDETFPGMGFPEEEKGRPADERSRPMRGSDPNRTRGVPLMLGGVCLAAFILLHPFDALAGAHGALMSTWVPAHTLHFMGALFALIGLVQLRERWSARLDGIGRTGLLIAFVGTAMFVGTGMITAFVWPVIADHDPGFVAATGPMFEYPLTSRSIEATYVCMVAGYVLLALGLARARLLTGLDAALLGVGILMFGAPVEPVGPAPWILRVAGGVVFGAALVRTGLALRAAGAQIREKSSARVDAHTPGVHP